MTPSSAGSRFTEPVLWAEGRRLGIPRRTLFRAMPEAPVPSVRVPATAVDAHSPQLVEWQTAQALARNIEGLQVNGLTAARRHGLRLPLELEAGGPLTVNRPSAWAHVQRHGVRCTRRDYPPEDLVQLDGTWITTPLRTGVDVLRRLNDTDAIILLDGLVSTHDAGYFAQEPALAELDALQDFALGRRRLRGLPRLRALLPRVRVGSDSAMETRLRLKLEEDGVRGLVLGHPVGLGNGMLLFQSDLALVDAKLSIQFESRAFHSDPEQVDRDIERARRTASVGWTEIRIRATDLRQREIFHGFSVSRATALVLRALEERGCLRDYWCR